MNICNIICFVIINIVSKFAVKETTLNENNNYIGRKLY